MLSVCQATPISPAGPAADSPDNPTFCSLCLSATLASDAGFHVFPRPAGKRAQPPPEREQPLPAGPAGLRRASTEPAKDPRASERCHRAACPPAGLRTRALPRGSLRLASPHRQLQLRSPERREASGERSGLGTIATSLAPMGPRGFPDPAPGERGGTARPRAGDGRLLSRCSLGTPGDLAGVNHTSEHPPGRARRSICHAGTGPVGRSKCVRALTQRFGRCGRKL